MGTINRQKLFEHIAQATGKTTSEVERAAKIQAWKDMVDFTSFRGVDLLGLYLKSQGIRELKKGCRLAIQVPASRFEEPLSKEQAVEFYIDEPYSGIFKKKYNGDFAFT